MQQQLSQDFRHCLRLFAFYYTNGTLNWVVGKGDVLKGIDYRHILVEDASLVEQTYAIYSNNIKLDAAGKVLNHELAMRRAAQYIRSVCDSNYIINPPLADWEEELV
ncbi:MAG TPA: hypothetical protein VF630_18350 [Hymenobacter sp.]|jgi:hypothetical protein